MVDSVKRLRTELDGGLRDALGEHVTRREIRALIRRIDRCSPTRAIPGPSGRGPAIPWPAF